MYTNAGNFGNLYVSLWHVIRQKNEKTTKMHQVDLNHHPPLAPSAQNSIKDVD